MSKRNAAALAMLLSLVALGASGAMAQDRYTRLVVYGDSYADNGNTVNGGFFNPAQPYPRHATTNVGFLTFLAYPTSLQRRLGIPDSGMLDYAFAGATSGPGIPGLILGYNEQIAASLTLGQSFGRDDLVVVNIGGNDGGASTGGLTSLAAAPGVAATAAANIRAGVQTLVDAGAQNFLINTFDDPSVIPNVASGLYGQQAIDADKLYGALLYAQEEAALAPFARRGARIFTFNLSQFGRALDANPAAYGFTNVTTPCQGTPGCATPAAPGQFTNATFDGLHLTTGGFAVAARYLTALIEAPATFPGEADFAQAMAGSFAASVFSRLDDLRYGGFDPQKPFSVYVQGAGLTGSRDGNSDVNGYHYDAGGGRLGFDYRMSPATAVGAVFSYASPTVSLDRNAGHYDTNSYQIAAYASYAAAHWFGDVLIGYGRNDYDLARPGVIDMIHGGTGADSYTVAAQSAYLIAAGPVRVGPLIDLRYTRSTVESYTETGDPLLTFHVEEQTLDGLDGGAGFQFRLPCQLAGRALAPYLNLTARHEFLDGRRTLLVAETQSPALPIYTRIEGTGAGLYGKAQLGLSAALTDSISVAVDVASSFGGGQGYDFAGNIGVGYRF